MRSDRRSFLQRTLALPAAASSGLLFPMSSQATSEDEGFTTRQFGDGELLSLSDGHLTLPVGFILPESIDADARSAFLASHGIGPENVTPPCNLTLWRTADRLVLFDVGAGLQFMPGAGLLPDSLAAAGIDPLDVTDVVLTHAHPDHLWGAIDDFDELTFPEATYHLHRGERDYWMAAGTLESTPDARKTFVVGAQNRLPRLDERLVLFDWGDEVLPGIEAVDTHGHTPGHTSFALHANGDSLLVLGDALTNTAISFERPAWPSGSDQDSEQGVRTRLALLDRLASEHTAILGFHLSAPGFGHVERQADAYRFVPEQ